jgi:hypothetical protein
MYITTFEDDLGFSIGRCGGEDSGVRYLKRFVMAVYTIGPLGILVAYCILRVEVSFERVVMTLFHIPRSQRPQRNPSRPARSDRSSPSSLRHAVETSWVVEEPQGWC